MPNFEIFDLWANKLETLPIEGVVERAADRQEDRMIELNLEQMDAGITALGAPIEPEYSTYTVNRKKKIGQPTDRVTLKDTGNFHNSVRVKRYPGKYELVANDGKSEKLQTRYGAEILGLTGLHLNEIRERMKPLMVRDIRNLLKI